MPVSVHPFKSRASSECEKGGIEVLKDVCRVVSMETEDADMED